MDQNLSRAIAAVKELFPHMENDIIEAIFKDCGGNLELTIDNLLEINNNNNNNSTSQHDHQQAHRSSIEAPSNSASKPSFKRNGKSWSESAYLNLPDNFLRITDDDTDEFAVMLQNEEFLNELRFNQEFLKTLEQDGAKQDERFEERLKHMGKLGRKKFYQLAKMFSFQRNKKSEHKQKSGSHHRQPLCEEE